LNCGFWLILVRTGVGGGVPVGYSHRNRAVAVEKETVTPDERRLAKNDQLWRDLRHGRAAVCARNRDKGVRWRLLSGLTSDIRVFAYLQRMQQEAIALGYVETILASPLLQFHERSPQV